MGVSTQLAIEVTHEQDGQTVVFLDGELDIATAPLLQEAIDSAMQGEVASLVLDLEQLEFIDSAGLRVLIAARDLCHSREQGFGVTRGTQQVERVLSVTGLRDYLQLSAETDDDAG